MSVEMVRLGDVAKVVSGATPKTANADYWDGEIFWATPKDLSDLDEKFIFATARRITEQGLKSCSSELLPVGSVLLSSRAPIGYTAVTAAPMATNQGFKSLIPRKDRLDASYLYYCLRANKEKLNSLGRGATFKEISKGIVENFLIPLPPLERQREIAAVLDKVDDLRAKRRQSIGKLEELLQSTFLEMFGDPVENPKGWEVRKLGEVGEIRGGLQLSGKRRGNPITSPYLRVANVYRNKIILDEVKRIEVTQVELDRTKLSLGDVLFVEGHGNAEEIGRCAVWGGEIESCVHQNHLIRFTSNGTVNPYFMSFCLNTPSGSREIKKKGSTTSGLNTISTGKLKDCSLIVPPIDSQIRFSELFKLVTIQRERQEYNLQHLDTLYSSLQAKFFGAGA